jgi:hypothetical protein
LIPQKIQDSGAKFSEEESRTVKKFILEGRLNGLDLAPREFQHYNNTLSQIGQERAQFFGKVRVSLLLNLEHFCKHHNNNWNKTTSANIFALTVT